MSRCWQKICSDELQRRENQRNLHNIDNLSRKRAAARHKNMQKSNGMRDSLMDATATVRHAYTRDDESPPDEERVAQSLKTIGLELTSQQLDSLKNIGGTSTLRSLVALGNSLAKPVQESKRTDYKLCNSKRKTKVSESPTSGRVSKESESKENDTNSRSSQQAGHHGRTMATTTSRENIDDSNAAACVPAVQEASLAAGKYFGHGLNHPYNPATVRTTRNRKNSSDAMNILLDIENENIRSSEEVKGLLHGNKSYCRRKSLSSTTDKRLTPYATHHEQDSHAESISQYKDTLRKMRNCHRVYDKLAEMYGTDLSILEHKIQSPETLRSTDGLRTVLESAGVKLSRADLEDFKTDVGGSPERLIRKVSTRAETHFPETFGVKRVTRKQQQRAAILRSIRERIESFSKRNMFSRNHNVLVSESQYKEPSEIKRELVHHEPSEVECELVHHEPSEVEYEPVHHEPSEINPAKMNQSQNICENEVEVKCDDLQFTNNTESNVLPNMSECSTNSTCALSSEYDCRKIKSALVENYGLLLGGDDDKQLDGMLHSADTLAKSGILECLQNVKQVQKRYTTRERTSRKMLGELRDLVQRAARGKDRSGIRSLFLKLDESRTGEITVADMTQKLRKRGVRVTQSALTRLMGSSKVSFTDFCRALEEKPSPGQYCAYRQAQVPPESEPCDVEPKIQKAPGVNVGNETVSPEFDTRTLSQQRREGSNAHKVALYHNTVQKSNQSEARSRYLVQMQQGVTESKIMKRKSYYPRKQCEKNGGQSNSNPYYVDERFDHQNRNCNLINLESTHEIQSVIDGVKDKLPRGTRKAFLKLCCKRQGNGRIPMLAFRNSVEQLLGYSVKEKVFNLLCSSVNIAPNSDIDYNKFTRVFQPRVVWDAKDGSTPQETSQQRQFYRKANSRIRFDELVTSAACQRNTVNAQKTKHDTGIASLLRPELQSAECNEQSVNALTSKEDSANVIGMKSRRRKSVTYQTDFSGDALSYHMEQAKEAPRLALANTAQSEGAGKLLVASDRGEVHSRLNVNGRRRSSSDVTAADLARGNRMSMVLIGKELGYQPETVSCAEQESVAGVKSAMFDAKSTKRGTRGIDEQRSKLYHGKSIFKDLDYPSV